MHNLSQQTLSCLEVVGEISEFSWLFGGQNACLKENEASKIAAEAHDMNTLIARGFTAVTLITIL